MEALMIDRPIETSIPRSEIETNGFSLDSIRRDTRFTPGETVMVFPKLLDHLTPQESRSEMQLGDAYRKFIGDVIELTFTSKSTEYSKGGIFYPQVEGMKKEPSTLDTIMKEGNFAVAINSIRALAIEGEKTLGLVLRFKQVFNEKVAESTDPILVLELLKNASDSTKKTDMAFKYAEQYMVAMNDFKRNAGILSDLNPFHRVLLTVERACTMFNEEVRKEKTQRIQSLGLPNRQVPQTTAAPMINP